MANKTQFEQEMDASEVRLFDAGWDKADMKDVMMVGFKYMASRPLLTITMRWKVLVPAGVAGGSALLALGSQLLA